ncbi:MAG: CHAT domain-containing protein [Moorea sp. SIO1F2]|uniref:CHAT domain-containing protein n=1 Tax=Moorena sp. SIO1F2 TaxID=2607819 RepID=UPI0013B77E3C|nr:CHAT domain-containing tetratricopeptide repeat protein [Moorena sp. SIO1F2]NET80837.1 CHAT domain-containing protein [Moorena sp. SIO1F2]
MDEQRFQEYCNFLMSILWAVATNPSPQSVYPLLKDNLDKLDDNLGPILQFRARETLPQLQPKEAEYLAKVIGNFGNLIRQLTLGNIANNLEIAIASYQVVATVFTLEAFPQDWATTQNNLGAAYSDRIKGERADNIEQAIAHYKNALQISTKSAFPQDWAMTQNNLGNAYLYKIKGEIADNIEQAIAHYQNALEIRTKSAFPQDWATTQNNLGAAYSIRIKGDRADNIEQAIAHYKNALQILTKLAFPQDWASTQNNLGNAYFNRIKGDRADNIEQAIAHYENALQIRTKLAFTQDWAMTQNNLGNAYCDRIKGDRADNIEQAIAHYENALQIRTKSAFPQDWATTQNNLGNAYKKRIKRERADNIEQAITAYGNALQILTPANFPFDSMQTASNLGNVALENNNWQLAIESYALAIQAVEQSRSWAIDEERRQEIMRDAIDVYDNIVQACLNLGQIEKAVEYTERSRAQGLVDMMASNELYQGGKILPELKQLLLDYEELQQRINLLRFGSASEAVPVLAGSPDKTLSLGMGAKQSGQSLTRDALLQYQKEIQELEAQKQQVWQQLRRYDPVLAGQIQVEHLDWQQIQQLIEEPTTALLSFYTTIKDTHIFILRKDRSPQVFTCVGQGVDKLQNWIVKNWFNPYLKAQSEWKEKMGDFLQELAERLQLQELVAKYLTGIEELIIVPHLALHQIPFAALPIVDPPQPPLIRGEQEGLLPLKTAEQEGLLTENAAIVPPLLRGVRGDLPQTRGMVFASKSSKVSATKPVTNTTYLCDRFRIRLVPSCQILHYCHQRPAIAGQEMGIVEDATEDLPFTSFECKTLAEMYQVPAEQRLQGRNATVKSYQTLAQQVHIFHSSHHAKSNFMEPLKSELRLGDGSLTLGQLLTPGWRMPNLSEVFASACEVNFTVTKETDDLLSLATGFLCAGARSVVSTQWSVDDLASALLAIFYYHGRRSGMSCCQALQQGQIKLRNLTGKEFADNYQRQLTEHLEHKLTEAKAAKQNAKDQGDEEELDKWIDIVDKFEIQPKRLESLSKDDFPFAHPFFWAGFVSQGI